MTSKCIVCREAFKEGDKVQAFLRCPDDPEGSWTRPIGVDAGFQARSKIVNDNIKRKHGSCEVD